MKKTSSAQSAFLGQRALLVVLFSAATACFILIPIRSGLAFLHPQAPSNASQGTLTFEERVSYQRAIEDVYWRHRIWPKERPDPKPSLDAVMSQAQFEKKVADYLRKSQALKDYWQRASTTDQLQAEMDRMAQHTKQPEVLQELCEALGNNPFVIAECLARPALAEHLITNWYASDQRIHGELRQRAETELQAHPSIGQMKQLSGKYTLPKIQGSGCIEDTWTATAGPPEGREFHTAVWTGSEMIVWGGQTGSFIDFNTGGRYNPSTDSWTATNVANAPDARTSHTAVWTGNEMIVWGGLDENFVELNTGGRYNPDTDSWVATSTSRCA